MGTYYLSAVCISYKRKIMVIIEQNNAVLLYTQDWSCVPYHPRQLQVMLLAALWLNVCSTNKVYWPSWRGFPNGLLEFSVQLLANTESEMICYYTLISENTCSMPVYQPGTMVINFTGHQIKHLITVYLVCIMQGVLSMLATAIQKHTKHMQNTSCESPTWCQSTQTLTVSARIICYVLQTQ